MDKHYFLTMFNQGTGTTRYCFRNENRTRKTASISQFVQNSEICNSVVMFSRIGKGGGDTRKEKPWKFSNVCTINLRSSDDLALYANLKLLLIKKGHDVIIIS